MADRPVKGQGANIVVGKKSTMKITVTAKPKSKKEYVKKIDETNFIVAVNAPPVDDKANQAIIESLAAYFQLPKSRLRIVSGHTAKKKIIAVG